MKLDCIKEEVTKIFVDDYDKLKSLMDQINITLEKVKIEHKYNSYDEFCTDILNNLDSSLKNAEDPELTPLVMTIIINDMVKQKIVKDENYEKKINEFFENYEDNLDELRDKNKSNNKNYTFGNN
jgi:hypothetical protein